MATTTEMRAWLVDQGEDVPARGRLRPELVDKYEAAHIRRFDAAEEDWDLPDDDLPMVDADDLEPSVPLEPERRPRTQRTARAERKAAAPPVAARAGTLIGRLLGEDKKKNAAKRGAKKIPRTSLERFISNRYQDFGKLLANVSIPMSRCVQSQAAFAGIVWEDILRDTIVDRTLQPVVRAEDKLDKGFALVATPLAVLAVEQNQIALETQRLSPQQFAVRQMVCMTTLRAGLKKQLQIARVYADQISEKLAEDLELNAEVDALIAMIFAPPEQGAPTPEPEMAAA